MSVNRYSSTERPGERAILNDFKGPMSRAEFERLFKYCLVRNTATFSYFLKKRDQHITELAQGITRDNTSIMQEVNAFFDEYERKLPIQQLQQQDDE